MNAPTVATTALFAALVAAQAAARAVAKQAENAFHRYRYASAEAIIDEARAALTQAGLALLCDGWEFIPATAPAAAPAPAPSPDDRRAERERAPIGRVRVTYALVHASGESRQLEVTWPVILEKGRPQDKAEAGAITTSLAYLLRGLLLLPRDDDAAAMDRRDDRAYSPSGAPTGAPAPGSAPGSAAQLADEFVAQIARESSLESLAAIIPRVRSLNMPEADVARVRDAYKARKAELSALAAAGSKAVADAARAA